MFTGIIEDIGTVRKVTGSTLSVATKLPDIKIKDSVAVNGICLTVTETRDVSGMVIFRVDFSRETVKRTAIGKLKAGDKVNLERALEAESRLGGHMVSGHVEAVGRLCSITGMGNSKKFEFTCPAEFEKYAVEKGSIAVDGISLTVTQVRKISSGEFIFGVAVIPYTLKNTTLGLKKTGSLVNIETDMMAKYAVKSNKEQNKGNVTYDLLERTGFLK